MGLGEGAGVGRPQHVGVGGEQAERGDTDAGNLAADDHHAHQAARHAHLALGDEVGHVALERALGEVGRELQQQHESGNGHEVVRGGDAGQEDDVEQAADEDVRLAPAPARDGVVGERGDGRLDDDRDGERDDLEEGHVRWTQRLAEHGVEARLEDDVAQARPDDVDAQPVDRQVEQVRPRQLAGWAAGLRPIFAGLQWRTHAGGA